MSQEIGLQKQIAAHQHRLNLLKKQAAQPNVTTDPSIITEIEDCQTKLTNLEAQLVALAMPPTTTKPFGLTASTL